MNSIDITKLMVMLEKEPLNVIDIRTNYEYLNGHIPTAKNIDKNVLVMYPNKYLNKDGILALEIGYDQKEELIRLLEETEKYTDIYSKKDLGGNDRIIVCKLK